MNSIRSTAGVVAAIVLAIATQSTAAIADAQSIPRTQSLYQLLRQPDGKLTLTQTRGPLRLPAAGEVLVRVRATSLNRRDIAIAAANYPQRDRERLVPLSDGAGEVVAIGPDVTRVQVADRVAAIFFQTWLDGRPTRTTGASALGGELDGMLAQYVTLSETGVVKVPAHLSFEEAATLPCAAVTAWNGLVTRGRMQAGDYVLLQGTGGVSIFGLQFALAAGAKPIVTSSSEAKLARAKSLGAIATINYKTTPNWEQAVLAATNGSGVQQVLEVGGQATLAKSLAAMSHGGHIAVIGGLSGFGGDVPAVGLLGRNATVSGIYVGSRADFEAMNVFITQHRLRPIIDKVFEFKDARAAYAYLESAEHFGKVVIRH
jgi:NADPH:quinone reductase-like Zn-dependent oxidoreductase